MKAKICEQVVDEKVTIGEHKWLQLIARTENN
jgi:hypothetical protein